MKSLAGQTNLRRNFGVNNSEDMNEYIEQLEEGWSAHENTIRSQVIEISKLKSEQDESKMKILNLTLTVTRLREQLKQSSQHSVLATQLKAHKEQNRMNIQKINQLTSENNKLRTSVNEISSLKSKVSQTEAENSKLRQNMNVAKVQSCTEEISKLRVANRNLTVSNNAIYCDLQHKHAVLMGALEETEAKNSEIEKLLTELNQLRASKHEVELQYKKTSVVKEFEQLKTKWLKLTTLIHRLDMKLVSKKSKNEDPILTLRNLESQFDQLKQKMEQNPGCTMPNKTAQNNDKVSNQKRIITGLNKKIETLQKQISKLDSRNSKLHQQLQQSENDKKQSTSHKFTSETAINSSPDSLVETTLENSSFDENVPLNTETVGKESKIETIQCSNCDREYPSERRQVFYPCGHGSCPSCARNLKECYLCLESIVSSHNQFQ